MAVLSPILRPPSRPRAAALARNALWGLALLGAALTGWAQSREYQLKAAFIFHFTKFVDWPAQAFSATNAPLVIGIVGENPFHGALHQFVEGERVQGRPLSVRQVAGGPALGDCHVLFISRSENPRLPSLLNFMRGKPVLTVSDIDNFAAAGGVVELFVEENKIRFKVNQQVALTNGLTISSKLLRLADVVKREP